jgi:hypothetical protein
MEKQAEYIYNNILNSIISIMGNKGTNTEQLNKYGSFFIDNYKGTFARDHIPNLKNGESTIINLDTSDKNGSHWVALYKNNNQLYFYDSFGRPNLLPELNYKEALDYDAEQKVNQLDCGQRCISWLLFAKLYGVKSALLI